MKFNFYNHLMLYPFNIQYFKQFNLPTFLLYSQFLFLCFNLHQLQWHYHLQSLLVLSLPRRNHISYPNLLIPSHFLSHQIDQLANFLIIHQSIHRIILQHYRRMNRLFYQQMNLHMFCNLLNHLIVQLANRMMFHRLTIELSVNTTIIWGVVCTNWQPIKCTIHCSIITAFHKPIL